jgi:hypothetical protein
MGAGKRGRGERYMGIMWGISKRARKSGKGSSAMYGVTVKSGCLRDMGKRRGIAKWVLGDGRGSKGASVRSGGERVMGRVRGMAKWTLMAKKGDSVLGGGTVGWYGRRARRRGDLASRSVGYELAIPEIIGHCHCSSLCWRGLIDDFAHSTDSHVTVAQFVVGLG